jgi:spore maturation protein CgeB
MNVVFLKSKTFCALEVENALKKRSGKDINLLIVAIPDKVPSQTAPSIFDRLRSHLPAIVISINNTGYDLDGCLSDLFMSAGVYQCNWFLDDPFYEDIFMGRRVRARRNRLDFVSEESFVPMLKDKGFNAYFLPLATDPLYFNTDTAVVGYERDCAFVGNSSIDLLDSIITKDSGAQLEKFAKLLIDLKRFYYSNPCDTDIKERLLKIESQWKPLTSMDPRKFLFSMEWLVGYFYRRDFIIEIARNLKNRFRCFGDIYWSKFIDPFLVSTDACYYSNLCNYYRSTKVNLNINRIQIRTSFTQRIFDCKASGAFLLTEKRKLNSKFFNTEGINKELVEFTSWQNCLDLIDYFCEHDEEREKIAEAGRDKVLQEHTYDRRVEQIFEVCRKEWGI